MLCSLDSIEYRFQFNSYIIHFTVTRINRQMIIKKKLFLEMFFRHNALFEKLI